MKKSEIRIKWAIAAAKASTENRQARARIEDIQWFGGYVEPECCDPEYFIVCGDWNDIYAWDEGFKIRSQVDGTMGRLAKVLVQLGCELEWSDEWGDCSECGGLVRIKANSYSWTPYYTVTDYGIVCTDCADGEGYLEGIEGDSGEISRAFDPADYDYVLVQDGFEHGFHYGQDSDPNLIGDLMGNAGFSRWLFHLDGSGQFDLKFSLWLHAEEAERDGGMGIILAKRAIERGNTNGPSVAGAMARQLHEASVQQFELRKSGGDGILVSNVSMNNATTRIVSAKDFVEGRALDIEPEQ